MKEKITQREQIVAKEFAKWLGENHYSLANIDTSDGMAFWESPSSENGNSDEVFDLFMKENDLLPELPNKLTLMFESFLQEQKARKKWYQKIFWYILKDLKNEFEPIRKWALEKGLYRNPEGSIKDGSFVKEE